VQLALVEAAGRKIGTITDMLLLLCYHYDPSTGRYSSAAIGASARPASPRSSQWRPRSSRFAGASGSTHADDGRFSTASGCSRSRPPRWPAASTRCSPICSSSAASSVSSSPALIVVFAFRYRRRRQADYAPKMGKHVVGSLALEIGWSVIPFIISMTIFAWGASIYFAMAQAPADALEIFVVGRQWMWKLQHMEGRREIDELHVPVGRAVKLIMTSEDVIHSFYVPAFRVKPTCCRTATRLCGSSRRRKGRTTCSARSTAARSTRT
jgi:hypothetical protein